jgi:hypothetical protein
VAKAAWQGCQQGADSTGLSRSAPLPVRLESGAAGRPIAAPPGAGRRPFASRDPRCPPAPRRRSLAWRRSLLTQFGSAFACSFPGKAQARLEAKNWVAAEPDRGGGIPVTLGGIAGQGRGRGAATAIPPRISDSKRSGACVNRDR